MQLTLVENFYSWARTILFGNTKENGENLSETPNTGGNRPVVGILKDITGEVVLTLPFFTTSNYSTWDGFNLVTLGYLSKEDSGSTIFRAGTDNSISQKEDYELKGKIETGLSYSGSVNHSNTGLTYVLVIYNNSEENKEISEIGFYKKVRTGSDPAVYKTFLLGRATLDTPEVIAPQTSKTYQITLKL